MLNIIEKKAYFFTISLIIIVLGIIGLIVNGLNYDIQFQGGTIIQFRMDNDSFDANEIGAELRGMLNKKITPQKLQTFNPEAENEKINILMLKVPSDDTLSDTEINDVDRFLKEKYDGKGIQQSQSVQPFIASEIKKNGLKAVFVASIFIILYIWWRFSTISGLSAAMAALIALIHDALIMFSAYAIFKIPMNESFIAAILTILGYSLNDTIVVYDRIRENSSKMRKLSLPELVNTSIKQSFSRTIKTSVTTLIAILAVYIFAAINNIQSIKEFAFPLIIGIISGTYSSLFIASPLWLMWRQYRSRERLVSR
jgi:preprotein translocase subunit SecF